MTVYALTGGTGQIGQCLLYEILKNNLDRLDRIRVLCFGRKGGGVGLRERLRAHLENQGWRYLAAQRSDQLLDAVCAAIVPIDADMRADGLGLSSDARETLAGYSIDHFFHLAALTDFRKKKSVSVRLEDINVGGTRRVLRFVQSLSRPLRSFSYVGSAYSCGMTVGAIAPDYVNFDQEFQNPYQRAKLAAESLVRDFFRADKKTAVRLFRPSVVAGRMIEAPVGFVTKYDVYLGWGAYFLKRKFDAMSGMDFHEVVDAPFEMPVRIQAMPQFGLNIVPADFAAKVIYNACAAEHAARDYHVVAERDLPIGTLLPRILERVNVQGCTFTSDPVRDPNEFEAGYYRTSGALYTPYIAVPAPIEFDATSMLDLCRATGLKAAGVETRADLDLMLDFAVKTGWGFGLPVS